MDVIFKPSRGSPFYIEVGYFDTVLEIKEKIQKATGIPVSEQTLVFKGNTLHDDLNVHHSDILDRSCILLEVPPDTDYQTDECSPPPKIELLLKMPSPKPDIAVEMDANETIQKLKEKIHETEGMPVNQLVIDVNGIELHDHKSMQECELSDNSEVNVSVRSSSATSWPSSRNNGGRPKMRIFVVTKCGTETVPMEVDLLDRIGELRNKLEEMKLDLPQEGYFFVYKQNVMDDERSFRWHHVCQGDIIEVFGGSVSGGS
ncbi:hypothetical protein DH2020_038828 [Rehmannia glutinosa]|uniref:Ubiquitin-like domain-containing protein n=1 Tax=Rehmannia glutinosa TaxID=99300 RepID=A0ABR0UYN4_REHGL